MRSLRSLNDARKIYVHYLCSDLRYTPLREERSGMAENSIVERGVEELEKEITCVIFILSQKSSLAATTTANSVSND